jgi:periplasmic protein CpxP/Spy
MKTLIIALVFGIGVSGFAQVNSPKSGQSNMEKLTPEQRQQKHVAYLTKELTLDAKQQEAVGKILSEKGAKAQNLKAQKDANRASGTKMTAEERAAFKNTMLAERADTEAKMKAVLSADQYKKWLDLREENKEKMKDRMREKRGM